MKSQYEQIVRVICGDDWSSPEKSLDDRDGAIGVAIILAYLNGVPGRLVDLSRAIDVPPYIVEMAYKRLQMNGLFSPRSTILDDQALSGSSSLGRRGQVDESFYAWYYIAGMASGYTGKGFTRDEYEEMQEVSQ